MVQVTYGWQVLRKVGCSISCWDIHPYWRVATIDVIHSCVNGRVQTGILVGRGGSLGCVRWPWTIPNWKNMFAWDVMTSWYLAITTIARISF